MQLSTYPMRAVMMLSGWTCLKTQRYLDTILCVYSGSTTSTQLRLVCWGIKTGGSALLPVQTEA